MIFPASHFPAFGQVAESGSSFLLDTYSGALGAYSIARRLSTSYTGALIRIRRSTDNVEQDIGYDGSGNLDTAAITTFIGANSAFLVTRYDQSGSGNHQTQATAARQPRIVNAGTLETQNGKPSANYALGIAGLITTTGNFMPNNTPTAHFSVQSSNGAIGIRYPTVFAISTGSTNAYSCAQRVSSLSCTQGRTGAADVIMTNVTFSSALSALSITTLGNVSGTITSVSQLNNGTSGTVSLGSYPTQLVGMQSGFERLDAWWNGFISEDIHYTQDMVSVRTGVSSNQIAYYGIT